MHRARQQPGGSTATPAAALLLSVLWCAPCGVSGSNWTCVWQTPYNTYYSVPQTTKDRAEPAVFDPIDISVTEPSGVLLEGIRYAQTDMGCAEGVSACDDPVWCNSFAVSAATAVPPGCTARCTDTPSCSRATYSEGGGCQLLSSCAVPAPDITPLHTSQPNETAPQFTASKLPESIAGRYGLQRVWSTHGADGSPQEYIPLPDLCHPSDAGAAPGFQVDVLGVSTPEGCAARCAEHPLFCRYFAFTERVAFQELPTLTPTLTESGTVGNVSGTPTLPVTPTVTLSPDPNATAWDNSTSPGEGTPDRPEAEPRRFAALPTLRSCSLHAACDRRGTELTPTPPPPPPPPPLTFGGAAPSQPEGSASPEPFLSEGFGALYESRRNGLRYYQINEAAYGGSVRWEDAGVLCERQGLRLCSGAEVCYAFLHGAAYYADSVLGRVEGHTHTPPPEGAPYTKAGQFEDLLVDVARGGGGGGDRWVPVSDSAHEFVRFEGLDGSVGPRCRSRVTPLFGVSGGSARLPPFSQFSSSERHSDVVCCGKPPETTCAVPGGVDVVAFAEEDGQGVSVVPDIPTASECEALCKENATRSNLGFVGADSGGGEGGAAACGVYHHSSSTGVCTLLHTASPAQAVYVPPALPFTALPMEVVGVPFCDVTASWSCSFSRGVELPNVTDPLKEIDYFVVLLRKFEEKDGQLNPFDAFIAALRQFLATETSSPGSFDVREDEEDEEARTIKIDFSITASEELKRRAATLIRYQSPPFHRVRVLGLDVCYVATYCGLMKYEFPATDKQPIYPLLIGPPLVGLVFIVMCIAWKIRPTTAGKVSAVWVLNRIPRTADGAPKAVTAASLNFGKAGQELGADPEAEAVGPAQQDHGATMLTLTDEADEDRRPKGALRQQLRQSGRSQPRASLSGLPPLHPPPSTSHTEQLRASGPPQIEITPSPLTSMPSGKPDAMGIRDKLPHYDRQVSGLTIPDARQRDTQDGAGNNCATASTASLNSDVHTLVMNDSEAPAADGEDPDGPREGDRTPDPAKTLYAIAPVCNPLGCKDRAKAFKDFRRWIGRTPHTQLVVIECIFPGQAAFLSTEADAPFDVQVRAQHRMWMRENLINIAIEKALPPSWRYACWVDGCAQFSDKTWAKQAISSLRKAPVVQLYEEAHRYTFAPEEGIAVLEKTRSFASMTEAFLEETGGSRRGGGDCDFGWGFTRKAYEMLAGLPQFGIAGMNDRHLAFALIGEVMESVPPESRSSISEGYTTLLRQLEARAQSLKVHFGLDALPFLRGVTVSHYVAGSYADRTDQSRFEALRSESVRGPLLFDPRVHLSRDSNAVILLTDRSFVTKLKKSFQHCFQPVSRIKHGIAAGSAAASTTSSSASVSSRREKKGKGKASKKERRDKSPSSRKGRKKGSAD